MPNCNPNTGHRSLLNFTQQLRKSGQNTAPITARWYPPRDTQSRGPSLIPQTATFCMAMDNPKDSSFAAQN